MRYVLIGFTLFHGVAHLPGFIGTAEVPAAATRAGRLMWLALALAFAALAAGIWMRASWWLATTVPLALVSAAACLSAWPAARFGLIANVVVMALAALAIRTAEASLPVRDAGLERLWTEASPGQAVRLWMRGEIKLGGRWWPFTAEQVIAEPQGMVWAATVSLFGLPVRGADRFVGGEGSMNWKIFDLVPVASASGPDVTRSARGRFEAERDSWLFPKPRGGSAIVFPRWGNPDGGTVFREEMFGVMVEEERTFAGRQIPSRIRAGWYAGTPRFETEGVFFKAAIDRAEYK